MQWFGVDSSHWFVTEHHVEPLEAAVVEKIKRCNVSICFVTGRRQGLKRVLGTAKACFRRQACGLVVAPTDLSCFDAASRVHGTQEDAERASAIFARVGKVALQDRLAEKTAAWVEQNALGYGNAGGLTVFHYNTPTTTLTALWKDCDAAGTRWAALFPRRPRLL